VTSLVSAIHLISFMLTVVVFLAIIFGYFLDPYHPIRRTLDAIVQPMLAPIRRILPPMGMVDFSPLVLILLIRIVDEVLTRILL
jgi:YggT family protein